jgi:hypothetical protein
MTTRIECICTEGDYIAVDMIPRKDVCQIGIRDSLPCSEIAEIQLDPVGVMALIDTLEDWLKESRDAK